MLTRVFAQHFRPLCAGEAIAFLGLDVEGARLGVAVGVGVEKDGDGVEMESWKSEGADAGGEGDERETHDWC
jgi:hypothetical protein